MSNIRAAIQQMDEPSKTIGEMLIEFYDTMKVLENDPERGGKQATKIVMTMNDIEKVFSGDSEDLKKALEEAANWETVMTEEESTKISYSEAKEKVLKRIFDKWKIKLTPNG